MEKRLIIVALAMIASSSKSNSNRCYATQLISRIQHDEEVRCAWNFVNAIEQNEPHLYAVISDELNVEIENERRRSDDFVSFCNEK